MWSSALVPVLPIARVPAYTKTIRRDHDNETPPRNDAVCFSDVRSRRFNRQRNREPVLSIKQLLLLSTTPIADRVRAFLDQRKLNAAYRDLEYFQAVAEEARRGIRHTTHRIVILESNKK